MSDAEEPTKILNNASFNNTSFRNVSFSDADFGVRNVSFGGRSFNASFNASFGSQAALEVSSDLKNMSFGSQTNASLVSEWQFWFDTREGAAPAAEGGAVLTSASSPPPTNIRQALGVISTIKLFWWFYKKLQPGSLPAKIDSVQLFKNGVDPTWGHARNRRGGHYKMVCKTKGHLQRLWLDLCMVLVGKQFGHAESINGAAYHLKKQSVTFWLSDAEDEDSKQAVRARLVKLLPAGTTISFKDHASLLGKESALTVSADIIEGGSALQIQTQTKECSKLTGIAADLIPPGQGTHRSSNSCPEDVFAEVQASFDSTSAAAAAAARMVAGSPIEPLFGRPRAASEAANRVSNFSFDEFAPPQRGRSLSRVEIRRRESESGPSPVIRKTLSADALDEYIPSEPIQHAAGGAEGGGLRHVASWADDDDSAEISSRCVSPAAHPAPLRPPVEYQLPQPPTEGFMHPMAGLSGMAGMPGMGCGGQSPPHSPGSRPPFPYDQAGDWDHSGPPSLAHSVPTSPQNPIQDQHLPYAHVPQTSAFSLGTPVVGGDAPQQQQQQQPAFHDLSSAQAQAQAAALQQQILQQQPTQPTQPAQPHHYPSSVPLYAAGPERGAGGAGGGGGGAGPQETAEFRMQLDQILQQQQLLQGNIRRMQPPLQAGRNPAAGAFQPHLAAGGAGRPGGGAAAGAGVGGGAAAAAANPGANGMLPPGVQPWFLPMSSVPGIAQQMQRQQQQQQQQQHQHHQHHQHHQQQHPQQQQPQPHGHLSPQHLHHLQQPQAAGKAARGLPQSQGAPAAAPSKGRVRGGIVNGGPVGVVYGSLLPPANPHNLDMQRIKEHLFAPGHGVYDDDRDEEKFSKSRSPRNRRKIRERKIREAAGVAKKEMEVYCPVCPHATKNKIK